MADESTNRVSYISTPCIMVCTLNEDDICIGCYRSLEEIGAWGDANTDERIDILDNAADRFSEMDL
jgi:predicted Fe-S protein YdhL (DUF1289 family)